MRRGKIAVVKIGRRRGEKEIWRDIGTTGEIMIERDEATEGDETQGQK